MYDNLEYMRNKKTVVITGGNRGIGLGITKVFLKNNYIVIVGSRSPIVEDLNNFKNSIIHLKIDVKKEDDHIKIAKLAIEKTGRLDCYINNAGYSKWKPIDKIDNLFLSEIIETNLKGVFWGCKAASLYLNSKNRSIINISSIAGKRGSSNNSAYVSTKFGVNGLTQSLSKELGSKKIRVNAVCPVLIKTKGLISALEESDAPGNKGAVNFIKDFTKSNSPLMRMPIAEEIGEMCLFLSSDSASAITGQCINVDCGVLPQ